MLSGRALGAFDHLQGMPTRLFSDIDTAEHACNFVDARIVVKAIDTGFGGLAIGHLMHTQLMVGL